MENSQKGKYATDIIAAIIAIASLNRTMCRISSDFMLTAFYNIVNIQYAITLITLAVFNLIHIFKDNDKRRLSTTTVIATPILLLLINIINYQPYYYIPSKIYYIIDIVYAYVIPSILIIGLFIAYIICNTKFPTADTKTNSVYKCYLSTITNILLLLILGWLWQMIWIYRTSKFVKTITAHDKSLSATLVLCIFFPPYIIYWTYKSSYEIDKLAKSIGLNSDITDISTALSFYTPVVSQIIMQRKLNQIANATL